MHPIYEGCMAFRLFQKNKLAAAITLAVLYSQSSFAELPTDPSGNYAQANSGDTLNLTGSYDAIMATGGGVINSPGGLILGGNGVGRNGNNITATGRATKIDLTGGSVFSEGTLGYGAVSADSGATLELHSFNVEASGSGKTALNTNDNGTFVLFSNSSYVSNGDSLPFAYANGGSVIEVSKSALSTTGSSSALLNADLDSTLNAHENILTTAGKNSSIASSLGGSEVLLADNIMRTEGEFSTALFSDEAFSAIQSTGGSITTTGTSSHGAQALNGGSIALTNT
ncbi:TPA: hypothetical protein VDU70_004558, partial [Pseudomonas aeruginosa]|nr:hypothetical protein [Pseudomonas aeruginosa]HEP8853026.1 hypothetical protein [Pseudomonas aeruginosa]